MKALVTAGGTQQSIDEVRVITNISGGSLGAEIAQHLSSFQVNTTLLGSKSCLKGVAEKDFFNTENFISFEDLKESISKIIAIEVPDIVFMAAAVSDYAPVPVDGKISSGSAMNIKLHPLPKLISTLRELTSKETFIVGFKLLSNVTEETLVEEPRKQIRDNRLNLCVANDSKKVFGQSEHPVLIVTPEGGVKRVNGSKSQVALELVKFVLERSQCRWFRSEVESQSAVWTKQRAWLLDFALSSGMLEGLDGNVSMRLPQSKATENTESLRELLQITPRSVDKSSLEIEDMVPVSVDLSNHVVHLQSSTKASIDTGVHAIVYKHHSYLDGMIHFHSEKVLAVPDLRTKIAAPCGTVEEAQEILRSLSKRRHTAGNLF